MLTMCGLDQCSLLKPVRRIDKHLSSVHKLQPKTPEYNAVIAKCRKVLPTTISPRDKGIAISSNTVIASIGYQPNYDLSHQTSPSLEHSKFYSINI